jgi:hypothetical protein
LPHEKVKQSTVFTTRIAKTYQTAGHSPRKLDLT